MESARLRARVGVLGVVVAVGCGDDGATAETETDSGTGSTSSVSAPATQGTSAGTETQGEDATITATTGTSDTTEPTVTGSTTDVADTGTTGAGTGTTGADTGTTGSETTGGLVPVDVAPPQWLRTMLGLNRISFGPDVEPLPNGQIFWAGTGGLYAHMITLGEGEAGEMTLGAQNFSPVVAWLDGSDGTLQDARMLVTPAPPMSNWSGAYLRAVDVSTTGDLYVVGGWWGEGTFHRDTPYETNMTTQTAIVGNQAHRAEDPYYIRMDQTGVVDWNQRGWTPGPLSQTWFNNPNGVGVLPDGSTLISGRYEDNGFVVGYGTPGATTLPGTLEAYFARLDPDGVPVWVSRVDAGLAIDNIKTTPSGAVYAVVSQGVLFTGEAEEITIPPEADDDDMSAMQAVIRLDPAGGVDWVRRLVVVGSSYVYIGIEVRDDDSVVLVGNTSGELQIRDEMGVAATATTVDTDAFVGSIAADGTVEWITALGLPAAGYTTAVTVDADSVWYATSLPGDATEVPLDGGAVPLPALNLDQSLNLSLIHRIDPTGAAVEARVLGAGLVVQDLTMNGGAVLVTGMYSCTSPIPYVVDAGGDGVALPDACQQPDDNDQRGYVMSVPL